MVKSPRYGGSSQDRAYRNGLMREGEAEKVAGLFKRLGVTVDVIDAKNDFFSAEIIREVTGIVRFTYNIAPKPPSTIEAVWGSGKIQKLEISELQDKKIFSRKVGVTCEVYAESSQSSLIPRCRNMGHMNLAPVEFLQFFHGQLGGRVDGRTNAEGD